MQTQLRNVILAALLTTTWPTWTQYTAAVDGSTCQFAAVFDLRHGAKTAICQDNLTPSQAGFQRGWDVIKGYNDDHGRVKP